MSLPNAATPADITSADWSLMLDSTAANLGLPSGLGNVVQGVADVEQCILIILETPKGSDPFRPTFGCDLWSYVDKPLGLAAAHIVREVTEAISTWEPRVKLLSVAVTPVLDATAQSGAHLEVAATWQLDLGSTPSSPVRTVLSIAPARSN
jgi:phage baseplate assembly protein W